MQTDILALVLALLVSGFSYFIGRKKFYWPLNPIFVFVTSFALVLCLFLWVKDHFQMASPSITVTSVLLSQLFIVPLCILLFSPNTSTSWRFTTIFDVNGQTQQIPTLLLWLLLFLGFTALTIFALYVNANKIFYGDIIHNLNLQRLKISQGIKPEFFYWFYLAEILPPIYLLICWEYKVKSRARWVLLFLGVACTLSLFFTGAKVNFLKPIKFILMILLLKMWHHRAMLTLRGVTSMILAVVIPMSLLLSYMVFSGDKASFDVALQNIVLRFSAQIAALDAVVSSKSPEYLGLLMILPIAKVLSLFDIADAPKHILPFYDIPFSWNVATYLEAGYRDFGLPGLFVIQFYFSVFVAAILWFAKYCKTRSFSLVLFLLMTNFCFSAISIAPMIKPIYWFQIGMVILLDQFVRTIAREPSSNVQSISHTRLRAGK